MRKSLYAGTALLLLALAAGGCDTTTGPASGPDGRAAVSLTIAGMDSRSVLPTAPLVKDIAQWRLWGGKTGEPQDPLTNLFANPADLPLYLETGAWDFTLEGYGDGSGKTLMLRGSITDQEIALDQTNTLSFIVGPVFAGQGTGSVRIVIELPEGHGITRAELVEGFEEDLTRELPITPGEDRDRIVFETTRGAGNYYFSFRLYQGEELCGMVSELVGVGLNLSSERTYRPELQDLDLLYTLAWDLKGGEYAGELPEEYRSTDAGFKLPQPNRDGYEFEGWHIGAVEGEKVADLPQGSVGDRDFYAQWTPVKYPISYRPEGIDYGDNQGTYTVEDEVALQVPPDPAGFRFDGWYTDSQLQSPITGVAIPVGETGPKTFYAKWDRGVSVKMILQTQPDDPALADASIFADEEAGFSAAGEGYLSWQWRWDGKLIGGAESATYTLEDTYKIPGVHELSVVATAEDGQTLSARCQVTIKATKGDPE